MFCVCVQVVVFSRAVLDQVKPSDGNHVFTQAEEMKLLYHVLQSVTIDPVCTCMCNCMCAHTYAYIGTSLKRKTLKINKDSSVIRTGTQEQSSLIFTKKVYYWDLRNCFAHK